jgi:hypothetical protein
LFVEIIDELFSLLLQAVLFLVFAKACTGNKGSAYWKAQRNRLATILRAFSHAGTVKGVALMIAVVTSGDDDDSNTCSCDGMLNCLVWAAISF